jgi:hypothetical protein
MKRTKKKVLPLAERGEVTFRAAVAKVVKQHREAGVPLALWRNGKVVLVPASKVKL